MESPTKLEWKKVRIFVNQEIYLAGGCFWGLEHYLAKINGVIETEVGYANGACDIVTYQQVCYNGTGHAETVRVVYDSEILSLELLLSLYYQVIDPISVNRQGGDQGVQYRTGVYYTDPEDELRIRKSLSELQVSYDCPIAIELAPLKGFCRAEEYHQKYLNKNPHGYCHISSSSFKEAERANR